MRWFAALALLLLLLGCSRSERISLVANPYQQSLMRDGDPALISTQKQIVMLRPAAATIRRGERPAFIVAVYNRSNRPTELQVAGITAVQTGLTNQAPNHVYTYDELVAETRRKQAWAAVGAAVAGAAGSYSAANAGYSQTYGTYSGRVSGPYSSATMSGTYSSTTYDAGRAYAAQSINNAQTAANLASIQAQGQQRLSELQTTILKDNTVLPGEWVGGMVVLDIPDKTPDGVMHYQTDVHFGNEVHSFTINQAQSS
jgi:hypothetical protein